MHLDSEAPDEDDERELAARRSRPADLFSVHRYRQLQVKLFENRLDEVPAEGVDDADDEYDPIVPGGELSDAPYVPYAALSPASVQSAASAPSAPDGLHEPRPDDVATQAYTDADVAEGELTWASLREEQDAVSPVFAMDAMDAVDAEPEHEPEPEAAPAKPKRDLRAALVVGISLMLLVVIGAVWSPLVFTILVYGFCIAGAVEWSRALRRQGRHIPLVPIILAIVGMGIATWNAKPEGLVIALLVGCAGVIAWRLGDERIENTLADAMAATLTLMWIPFLASFAVLLELAQDGWMRVLVMLLAVVGNDTGGLLFGSLFGKHRLIERVSPSKTWEGLAGGLGLGTVGAAVASFFFFDGRWWIGAVVGLASAMAAVVGDLAESAIKRDLEVKDMSSILPGHGGILDRLDSIVFAAPVAYVVFAFFLGTLGSL